MFKNDATDVGVSDDDLEIKETELEETLERQPTQRELMMEQIYNKRLEDLKDDGVIIENEDEQDKDKDKNKSSDKDIPETVTVKIDGVEQTLTKEDFEKQLKEYQKHKAADKRLEEAALKIKEIEQREATLKKQEEDSKKKTETKKEEEFDISSLDGYNDLFEEFTETIRDGNDKDAVKAVKKFTEAILKLTPKSTSSTSVDEQVKKELTRIREEEEAQRQKDEEKKQAQEVEKAKSQFNTKYKEILDKESESYNADFLDLAIMEDSKLMKDSSWENKPLTERFLQAGENAQKWLRGKGNENKIKNDKKNLRKDSDKTVIAALKDKNEKPSPMTPSEIIADMKRKRGQIF